MPAGAGHYAFPATGLKYVPRIASACRGTQAWHMKFWDSSAIIPLLVREPASGWACALYAGDMTVVVAWTAHIECASAIARRALGESLTTDETRKAHHRLAALAREWIEILPTDRLKQEAVRMVSVHELRTLDSVQLSSAVIAANTRPDLLPFVTSDQVLAEAAEKQGFPVVRPSRT